MIITDKLAKYKSKQYCNLDLFKIELPGHNEKKWQSRDGKHYFIKDMQTRHLWYTFQMLMGIIDSVEFYENISGTGPDFDSDGYVSCHSEFIAASEQADLARVAIQYIGHELFKRGMQVPALPENGFKKKINRADNLHRGFVDIAGDVLTFKNDWNDD